MDRVAVFVDAGHLFAGGSAALAGEQQKRQNIKLDVSAVVAYLSDKARFLSADMPLLRIYWYDGALAAGLTTPQRLLAAHDNVKLRLGVVNGFGEQKGVDAKIVTELAELARNGAICDAVLMAGDEDIRIGVELAQEKGVRVHLLTVEGSGVSTGLRYEADTTSHITKDDLATFMSIIASDAAGKEPGSITPVKSVAGQSPPLLVSTPECHSSLIDHATVVQDYLGTLLPEDKAALVAAIADGSIPSEHDGKILARARDSVKRQLQRPEIQALRKELKRAIRL